MGDSGSMLIGLVLAAGAISITGQVDPDAMKLFAGPSREAAHAMVPVFIPLLLPLTIIAIPVADLVLAIVRRTWNGPVAVRGRPRAPAPPAAGDRPLAQPGRADHVLLVGADRLRRGRVLGALGVDVDRARRSCALSAVGLVLLLLPRFTPRAPRWAERLRAAALPAPAAPAEPRRRRRRDGGPEPAEAADGTSGRRCRRASRRQRGDRRSAPARASRTGGRPERRV